MRTYQRYCSLRSELRRAGEPPVVATGSPVRELVTTVDGDLVQCGHRACKVSTAQRVPAEYSLTIAVCAHTVRGEDIPALEPQELREHKEEHKELGEGASAAPGGAGQRRRGGRELP